MIDQRDLMIVPWRTGGYHKTAKLLQVTYSQFSLICHIYLLTRYVLLPAARQGNTKLNLLAPSFQLIFWGREDLFFSSLLSLLASPLARMPGVGGMSPWALWDFPWLPPPELKRLLWFSWCLSPCLCCCWCSQGCCRCRSASWSLGGEGRESLTQACIHHCSLQPQHMKTRVKGWSSASSGSALAALVLCLMHQPNAPKYMTASILSPCHSSPSHWCERVLYLPRRVMKIAMTMIVVAWECKELILPE